MMVKGWRFELFIPGKIVPLPTVCNVRRYLVGFTTTYVTFAEIARIGQQAIGHAEALFCFLQLLEGLFNFKFVVRLLCDVVFHNYIGININRSLYIVPVYKAFEDGVLRDSSSVKLTRSLSRSG